MYSSSDRFIVLCCKPDKEVQDSSQQIGSVDDLSITQTSTIQEDDVQMFVG